MEPPLNLPSGQFLARALLLATRLDLRNWPEGSTLARAPLTVQLPDDGRHHEPVSDEAAGEEVVGMTGGRAEHRVAIR